MAQKMVMKLSGFQVNDEILDCDEVSQSSFVDDFQP